MNTMTKTVSLSFLCAALAFFSVDVLAADSAVEVVAIHAVDQAWLKAYNGGDADAIAGLYDEKAILLPPGAPAPHGRAAIHAFFASDIAASKKAGVIFHLGPNPDGGANGDMGWASGTYSVTDASGKVVDSGKYLSVSKKEGAKWLYIRDTWNSDIAAPAEASVAPKK
jgi:ketosteroid isomerase-like protein